MPRIAATLGVLAALLASGDAAAARDPRVLKAIDLFDRAEFTRAKDLLVTLVDAPALSEEDHLQARMYLGASYYGLGDHASAKAQFLMLVRRYPRVELDPGQFLPEVVDLFHQARMEVARETPAPPEPAPPVTDRPLAATVPPPAVTAPAPPPPAKMGASPLSAATFLPFGAGQFARGDAMAGHLFLWSEVGTLALAAAAKIHFQYLKLSPSRPWDFSGPAYVQDVGYATAVQDVFAGSLIASGVIAVAGIAESALRAGGSHPPVAVRVEAAGGGLAVHF